MKFHRKVLPILMAVSLFLCCTTSAFAGVNFGNDNGSDFKHGTEDNGWLLKTDNGDKVCHGYGYNLEGLRLTVYDAETQTKVYNTLDITGEPTALCFPCSRGFRRRRVCSHRERLL